MCASRSRIRTKGRRATTTNALAKTDLWAGVRSLVPERVCLSPSPFHPIRLSRSRSDYHPNHPIPRGTAIISFPARSADWLVQSQPRSGEEAPGSSNTLRFTRASAVNGRGAEESGGAARCRAVSSSSALLRRRAAARRRRRGRSEKEREKRWWL